MRAVVFQYGLLHGKYPAPIVALPVKGKYGWCKIWAFVDSGASFTIFSKEDADRLGIELTRGIQTLVTVGDGSQIPVYIHRLLVKIGAVEFKSVIGFSPRLGVGFSLMGRKDIFEHFDVTFSDSRRQVIFKPV